MIQRSAANSGGKSLAAQYADLKKLGDYLGAKDYGMGSGRIAASRQNALKDAYASKRGGGQGKRAAKRNAVTGKVTTSYGFTEHKGTWGTSKKK